MNKILIVGATSAIAYETAKLFARDGAALFLVARNPEKLKSVQEDLKIRGAQKVESMVLDLNELDMHQELYERALKSLGKLDGVLVAHGTLPSQPEVQQNAFQSVQEFNTNCTNIISLLTILGNYFEQQRGGCIAVITSVAGDRGRSSNYLYGAAKAGLSAFLSGLRNRLAGAGVSVLTIKPGVVATPMTAHLKKGLLTAKAEKAGADIYKAMQQGRDVIYTPWFWRYIMFIIRSIPEPVFKKLKL